MTVMFPAAMPKFKGDQKISRNSAIFEQIFDISSACRSEEKDLQLLCRSTKRYSRKFRDMMLCLRHQCESQYCARRRISEMSWAIGKFFITLSISNRLSKFLHHVVQK
jgi:hypothetical protein